MGWATFWAGFAGHWAIFFQKHPVTLDAVVTWLK
jgi:hypothetical protein